MSGVEVEITVGVVVAAFGIVGAAFVNGWAKRQEEARQAERERQEEQRRDTGRRIGRLERFVDFERGRQAGIAQGRRRRGLGE
jgi:hypothetical protein